MDARLVAGEAGIQLDREWMSLERRRNREGLSSTRTRADPGDLLSSGIEFGDAEVGELAPLLARNLHFDDRRGAQSGTETVRLSGVRATARHVQRTLGATNAS